MLHTLKKSWALLTVLLFIVLGFQNCDTVGFNGSEIQPFSDDPTPITDPIPDIATHGFVVERTWAGLNGSPEQKRVTKISAVLDVPVGVFQTAFNSNFKMLLTKEVESSLGEKCFSIYSVSRDDIRPLLSDLSNMKVLDARKESNGDVSAPTVMPNWDVYAVSLNDSKNNIYLGKHPWMGGPLYTPDLSIKDFEEALNEHNDKIISSHCSSKENKIQSFSLDVLSFGSFGQSPDVMHLTQVSAIPDQAVGLNGEVVTATNRLLITKKEASNFGHGTVCTEIYSLLKSDIAGLLNQLANLSTQSSESLPEISGGLVYGLKINKTKNPIYIGPFGNPYTQDINIDVFLKALNANKDKVISSHCVK